MNVKRTATILVVGGALAAWLSSAATSNRQPAPVIVRAPAVDLRGAELADEVARLHDRLRPDATPRLSRNLFQFASGRPRLSTAPPLDQPPAAVPGPGPAAAAPAFAPPPIKLSGIAEDAGPDGPLRTAIISGLGQLFLVKEGENVTSRYRVAKISADVVELTDLTDSTTLRLALK